MKSRSKIVRIDEKLFNEIKRIAIKNDRKFVDASKIAGMKLSRRNGRRFKFVEDIQF